MTLAETRRLIAADLRQMCDGQQVGRAQIAVRTMVHARWRAIVMWRLAQLLMTWAVTKLPALWLTDLTLVLSGAELQPTAQVGAGLVLKHTTGLVVGGDVVAGSNLTLHQNVTLGDRHPGGGQPKIGDDVLIGANACVLGPITIGSRAVVAAGALVLEDVPPGAVVAGNPSRIVRTEDFHD